MKKAISFLLIFSVLILSGSLYAKKKGAELVIVKLDGQQVSGELIAVKENSLLLLDSQSGSDVSISVKDANVIKVKKKSHALLGAGIGLVGGGGAGALVGALIGEGTDQGEIQIIDPADIGALVGLGIGALLGAIVGGYIGAHTNRYESFQIEGKSEAEIKKELEKLRNKARIPDFQ